MPRTQHNEVKVCVPPGKKAEFILSDKQDLTPYCSNTEEVTHRSEAFSPAISLSSL